jgi:hypothetical protein
MAEKRKAGLASTTGRNAPARAPVRASERITVELVGAPEDEGHLRLSELIKQLQAVKSALKQTERTITGKDEPELYYRVVGASHSSPLSVTIEPTPLKPAEGREIAKTTVQKFFTTLRMIDKKRDAPEDFDLPALEAYRDLGTMLDKHVTGITLAAGAKRKVAINKQFENKVSEIIGPDEIVEGSISGMLEWLNLHNTSIFHVYPVIGPKKVICNFPKRLKEKVKSAIDSHVEVYGELRYKKWGNFPYAMNVSELEILPPDNELPTLFDLRGVAPDATGGMSSVEFVRAIRDEGW